LSKPKLTKSCRAEEEEDEEEIYAHPHSQQWQEAEGNKTVTYSNIIMLNLTKVHHNTPTCSQLTPGTAIPAPYSCLPVNIPTYRSHENPNITSVHLIPYLTRKEPPSAEAHHPGQLHFTIGCDCGAKWTGRTKIKACICEASLR